MCLITTNRSAFNFDLLALNIPIHFLFLSRTILDDLLLVGFDEDILVKRITALVVANVEAVVEGVLERKYPEGDR